MSGMFSNFRKAQEKIYDPNDDTIRRVKNERNGYIEHACDVVVSVQSLRAGRVDNPSSRIDKSHFCVVEMRIEKILYQKEHKPIESSKLEAGETPTPAEQLEVGMLKDFWVTLPRFIHSDPDEYTLKELHQIGDLCDLIGGIFGVKPDAVDLSILDDLAQDDGAAIRGQRFGVKYDESVRQADEKRGLPERVYLNAIPYPVDQETMERSTPKSLEELEAEIAAAESAAE